MFFFFRCIRNCSIIISNDRLQWIGHNGSLYSLALSLSHSSSVFGVCKLELWIINWKTSKKQLICFEKFRLRFLRAPIKIFSCWFCQTKIRLEIPYVSTQRFHEPISNIKVHELYGSQRINTIYNNITTKFPTPIMIIAYPNCNNSNNKWVYA